MRVLPNTAGCHSAREAVTTAHMAKPYEHRSGIPGLFASHPDILAAPQLEAVIDAILVSRENGRGILWGMGVEK